MRFRNHVRQTFSNFVPSMFFVCLLLHSELAKAQVTEWIGTTGNWTEAANWDNGVPTPDMSAANIANGGTAQISSPVEANNVTLANFVGTSSGSLEVLAGGDATFAGLLLGGAGVGKLRIEGGGTVAVGEVSAGSRVRGQGELVVSGAGSSLSSTGRIWIATTFFGTANVRIEDGGTLTSPNSRIGLVDRSTGTVIVDGTGSIWKGGSLVVGDSGTGSVTVRNGGRVVADLLVGNVRTGPLDGMFFGTGDVTVTGTGSSLSATNSLLVGPLGTGTLSVLDGAIVESASHVLAGSSSVNNNPYVSQGTINVDGAGSTLISTGMTMIGKRGHGTLQITNGGKVQNTEQGIVGGSRASSALVDGPNSSWENQTELFVDNGTLDVRNGGTVTSADVRISTLGAGAVATVAGQDSTWANSGTFQIGAAGELVVEQGGSVTSDSGFLVGMPLRDEPTAVVKDAGSLLAFDNGLSIAANGEPSTVSLRDGATLRVGSTGEGTISLGITDFSLGTLLLGAGGEIGALDAGEIRGEVGGGQIVVNHDRPLFDLQPSLNENVSLVLVGPGTTRMSGQHNYSGQTNIAAGTLVFEGEQAGSGAVVIASGATLRAVGRINGNVDVMGSLDVGPDVGTLIADRDVSFAEFAGAQFKLRGTTAGSEFDQLTIGGSAMLGGELLVVAPTSDFFALGQQYPIIEVGNERTGIFRDLPENAIVGTFGGLDLRITYAGGDGNDVVLFTQNPIPEPTTQMLTLVALIARLPRRSIA